MKQLDKNLCQEVNCKSIFYRICKCAIIVDGKERIEDVRFCREHFLMQKAVDYHKEESE